MLHKDTRKRLGYFNVAEAAKELKISKSWLIRHRDHFPRRHRLGNRHCYDRADIESIRQHLAIKPEPPTRIRDERREAGYVSQVTAARLNDIPAITWAKAAAEGRIPKGSHRIGAFSYYTIDEAAEIAKYFDRKPPRGRFTFQELARRVGAGTPKNLQWYCKAYDLGAQVSKRLKWYTQTDVRFLKKKLTENTPPKSVLSAEQAAKIVGMPRAGMMQYIRYKGLKIGQQYCRLWYFTHSEIEVIKLMRREK